MQKVSSTKGFTLIEVLIAISLFAVVSTIAASVLVDVVQLQKKSSIQNEIFEDSRILMQQLTNEIQSGTIDYEEYYSVNVVQKKKPVLSGAPTERFFGINYGVYGSRFFDPGKTLLHVVAATNPDDLGIECSYPADKTKTCEIYFSDSTDLNTGRNPYKNKAGYVATDANALCDNAVISNSCNAITGKVSDLYLIDSSGTHKTIFGLKKMTDTDNAIGMMKMTGKDLDQNGVIDVFSCDSDYSKCLASDDSVYPTTAAFQYPFIAKCVELGTCKAAQCDTPKDYLKCNGIKIPRREDLNVNYDANTSQFIPITPSRANIKSLSFTINPIDDPYKAYAESSMQTQPTVTISMTIGLSSAYKGDYPGTFPDITLQTTVTAGVVGKIDSYPPVNDILRSNGDTSWICRVFNPDVNCPHS